MNTITGNVLLALILAALVLILLDLHRLLEYAVPGVDPWPFL